MYYTVKDWAAYTYNIKKDDVWLQMRQIFTSDTANNIGIEKYNKNQYWNGLECLCLIFPNKKKRQKYLLFAVEHFDTKHLTFIDFNQIHDVYIKSFETLICFCNALKVFG